MRILQEDTAVIIVDYQEKLIPVIHDKEELLKNTGILIQGLKELKVPMLVTQQYTKGLGMTTDCIRNLWNEDFTYFDKISFGSYDEEKIALAIKKLNKKNIIVCGIEAHICVLQTVIDLIGAGFLVIVVEDCISSRKEKDKETALKRFEREGAVVTTYESILFELTRKAGTDTFKAISKLIK